MIGVARSLPVPTGAPIEWLERDALDLRFEDLSFDVVLCQQGLQFFPDKAAALKEIRRVLKHGGRLALSVWANAGLTTVPSVRLSLNFWATKPPSAFALRGKPPLERNCNASQRKQAFLLSTCASVASTRTSRVWMNSH
jgi:ubiquinone/menaquinone biosynthesis C-methylase UbiE